MLLRPLLLLLLGLVASAAAGQTAVETVRVQVGDDLQWARPDWDDSEWETRSVYAPPDTHAVVWIRTTVGLAEGAAPVGVAVHAIAAREVYWDGVLIGRDGRVGTDREREEPGPIDALHPVPDSLSGAGLHTLALRLSTFRRAPSIQNYVHGVQVGDLDHLAADLSRGSLLALVFLGGFVLVALYYGVLWAVDRRLPYALVALLCLSVAALLGAESWRWVTGYAYDLHLTRLLLVTGLTCVVGLLLPVVFLVQFQVPRRRWIGGALAVGIALALTAPGGYDAKTLLIFSISVPVAFGVTAWAAWRRRAGAAFAFAGVAVCLGALLLTGYRFMDSGFFPAFGVLLAGLLASLGLQTRDQRRRMDAARAEAARLEAELLKTHLQPHFLMNTLTTVMEWIEIDPPTGVRVLKALADELRLLADLSQETRVPLARELDLCRTHLDVMSARREVRFELDAEGVDPSAPIPPAVLHTLLENAITHNAYDAGTVRFQLREAIAGDRRRLTLTAPLADPASADAEPQEGGGLGYVRARLEESHPGDWRLTSAVEAGAWVTRIDLPTASP